MKTALPIKKMMMSFILLLCLAPAINKAQSINTPYVFTNNTGCTAEFHYQFYDTSCSWLGAASITVGAGSSSSVPVIVGSDDIYVTVTWIDSGSCTATQSSIANVTCSPANSSVTVTPNSAPGCGCNSNPLNLTVGTSSTVLN